jgi:hypothetical protein
MALDGISFPDWLKLKGGDEEASWLSDRDRKLGLILRLSDDILDVASKLESRDALFSPSSEILVELPPAADWYVSLAGYALKTLRNINHGPAAYGMNLKADTIRSNLAAGRRVAPREVAAFAIWLRDEIEKTWEPGTRTTERALFVVSAILGGRALGQGQNAGGNEAVLLLKLAITNYAEMSSLQLQLYEADRWKRYSRGTSVVLSSRLKLARNLEVIFPIGGNVPDVRFESALSGRTLGVGEVKGRKDQSNLWESWMPTVEGHMRTWTRENPTALRLFFGTVIPSEMILGESVHGTWHGGLRELCDGGYLDGVFNLSHLALGEEYSWTSFSELMGYFTSNSLGPILPFCRIDGWIVGIALAVLNTRLGVLRS